MFQQNTMHIHDNKHILINYFNDEIIAPTINDTMPTATEQFEKP